MEYLAPEERDSVYGEVAWSIHPKRRYVTLEYSWRRGRTFRRAFKLIPTEAHEDKPELHVFQADEPNAALLAESKVYQLREISRSQNPNTYIQQFDLKTGRLDGSMTRY